MVTQDARPRRIFGRDSLPPGFAAESARYEWITIVPRPGPPSRGSVDHYLAVRWISDRVPLKRPHPSCRCSLKKEVLDRERPASLDTAIWPLSPNRPEGELRGTAGRSARRLALTSSSAASARVGKAKRKRAGSVANDRVMYLGAMGTVLHAPCRAVSALGAERWSDCCQCRASVSSGLRPS
jgi:hypothetical protein